MGLLGRASHGWLPGDYDACVENIDIGGPAMVSCTLQCNSGQILQGGHTARFALRPRITLPLPSSPPPPSTSWWVQPFAEPRLPMGLTEWGQRWQVMADMEANEGQTTMATRQALALAAYSRTAECVPQFSKEPLSFNPNLSVGNHIK